MESIHEQLVERIHAVASTRYPRRIIVGIAGPPGSGKTTIAAQLVHLLNVSTQEIEDGDGGGDTRRAVAVPMDGFHYTRAQLDKFSNSPEAHRRRGAPWTFDVDAVLNLVSQLRESAKISERGDILAPSFDHATKDPVENGICIPSTASIVILEGNYLLLNQDRWMQISDQLDLRFLVSVSQEEARHRVAARHIVSGIEPNLELAEQRYDSNDGLNGELIMANVVACDMVVESVSSAVHGDAVG